MGFFSWKTSDTNISIPNNYSNRETFTVHLITKDRQIFTESDYDGYGVFGGKDFYELVAELNGITEGTTEEKRKKGINICFKDNPSGEFNGTFEYPKLVEELPSESNWEQDWEKLPYPETCEYQGFFYEEDEEEEYDEEDEEEDYEEDYEEEDEDN